MAGTRLKPIVVRDRLAEPIAQEIEYHLWDLIYKPLLDVLKEHGLKANSLQNSKASLIEALRAGRVQYRDGIWSGEWGSGISRDLRSFGAVFEPGRKIFRLGLESVPFDVKQAVLASERKNKDVLEALDRELDKIEEASAALTGPVVPVKDHFQTILRDVDDQFHKSVSKDFEIPIVIDKRLRAKLTKEYSENLNLDIKTFRDEQVFKLRKQVEANWAEGFRSSEMIGFIQAQYGVTQRKARFLARQETSLLTVKYKREKYEDAGVTKYVWSSSHDKRTRQDHKDLDGQVFEYAKPPVTNKATGARNNPGEDYGCRCVDIPYTDMEWEKKWRRIAEVTRGMADARQVRRAEREGWRI